MLLLPGGGAESYNRDTQSSRVSGQLSASALWCCQFTACHTVAAVGTLRHSPGTGETAGHRGEMVLLTMIARLADGLPLAASMQEDEQVKEETLSHVVFGLYDVCLLALLMASSLNDASLERNVIK